MEGPKRKVAGTEQQEEGKRGDQEGPWEKVKDWYFLCGEESMSLLKGFVLI